MTATIINFREAAISRRISALKTDFDAFIQFSGIHVYPWQREMLHRNRFGFGAVD